VDVDVGGAMRHWLHNRVNLAASRV